VSLCIPKFMKVLIPFRTSCTILLFSLAASFSSQSAVLLSRDSSWKYRKGTSEASSPTNGWRNSGFDDSSWSEGASPFRYGDGSGGTVLDDMRDNYTTLFLRRTFNVSNVDSVSELDIEANYDDGFSVWINGTEVFSTSNAPPNPRYDSLANPNHESGLFESFRLPNPSNFLVNGENTIAIQVFNGTLSSSDLMLNVELISTAPDLEPPAVLGVTPEPGVVPKLTTFTVTFSEPVSGVSVSDIEVNGLSAIAVTGQGDQYTFTLPFVDPGQVTITWAQDHEIQDTADPPNDFDATILGEVRVYNIVDETPPVVTGIFPPIGVSLRSFGEVSVTFSEPVLKLDTEDLLANGAAADSVSGSGEGPYVFSFSGIDPGPVTISWAADHRITDLASEPNPLSPEGWSYTVDPNATFGDLVISEFMAANRGGLSDEDGEASDWIELHNFGSAPIALAGWSLSDNTDEPGKFVLPARTLPAGGYLVVFATGKNRLPPGNGEIHTNFKLAATGEYLGLFSPESPRNVADELGPSFPQQRNDHSYGRDTSGTWRYYAAPTPGLANGNSIIDSLLPPPHFNVARGFYDKPFEVHLTSPIDGATIRYTLDGSDPTASNGTIYHAPVRTTRTTVMRAAAFKPGSLPSQVVTNTYLYNVSSAIRSLPVVSIVTNESNLFGPTGIMETNPRNTSSRGIAWERPTSAELIDPEDNGGFQVDCGLRVQGGNYVRGRYEPNGGLPFSKYSFRLYFRGDYGPTMLDYPFFNDREVQVFDRITLRAGMNDHSNPFIVDELMRRLAIDTGQVGAVGNFVNLFINGDYKGYYNPTERIDDDFMRSWHGGDNEWDVIAQSGEVREGDNTEWNRMRSIVGRDMTSPANYAAALEVIDADNFIDYLLVNIYGGTGDWPHNNWRAARERIPSAKFRFYIWDAEWALGNQGRSVNGNTITGELGGGSEIATLFQSLSQSQEFRLRFADRVHLHLFNGGALEDDKVLAHYESMRSEMSGVLAGMSTSIRNTWIPQRRNIMMQHLADADLQRSTTAAAFSQHGGRVPAGFLLSMSNPGGGTLYYTLDGSDPRAPLDEANDALRKTILAENVQKRIIIPANGNLGLNWTGGNEPFNDNSWIPGTGGVGYDENPDYDSLIDIDVENEMNNNSTTCYLRIPFNVSATDLDGVNFVQLKVRYDDGFVAYLNGIRVASGNAPASPSWDSSATSDHADSSAVNFSSFNISDFQNELRIGSNLLAIHGFNGDLGSSDFLVSAEIEVGENFAGEVAQMALEYGGPVEIDGATTVKARTLVNGVWSALTEAEFFTETDTPRIVISEIMYRPTGGRSFEFVELFNAGTRTIDLGHMRFEGIDYVFRPGTLIGPGEYVVLSSDDEAATFEARYPGVLVHGSFGGSLSNNGERLALLDGLGNVIVSVDYNDRKGWPEAADGGGYSLNIIDFNGDPDDPANWTTGTTVNGTPGTSFVTAPAPPVVLTEVFADASGASDWVEIHNPGAIGVDISGWGFSDSGSGTPRFTFPANTQLGPNHYMILICDSATGEPDLHSGFGLDRDGESLFLTDASGMLIDAVSFGRQVPDRSISQINGQWILTLPTPGAVDSEEVALAPQSQLKINEWLADPLPGEDDWIELYNGDAVNPVSLRGLVIQRNDASFRIGALAFLAPGSHLRFWADQGVGPNHVDFRLPAHGASLQILARDGAEVDRIDYAQQSEGVSRGRLPDGSGTLVDFPNAASPGAPNYRSGNSNLVINELMADNGPGSPGWIEILNRGDAEVSLEGMSIAASAREPGRWAFAEGTTISARGYLAIAFDSNRPASTSGANFNTGDILWPSGGTVYLFDNEQKELDRVFYGNQVPGLSIGNPLDTQSAALLSLATMGITNSRAATLGSTTGLKLNEWLADSGGDDDFLELFNPGLLPVSLTSLRVTDDLSTVGLDQHEFGPLAFIGTEGFAAYIAEGTPAGGPAHLPFKLSANGETVRLYNRSGSTIIDEVSWGFQSERISSGRLPNGDSNIGTLERPTPGSSNEIIPHADTDLDGIPDSWETGNGLNANNPADALLDFDGDGWDNLSEYLSATDPNDYESLLRFDSLLFDDTGVTLKLTAKAGIRYVVEHSTSLQPDNWQTLGVIEIDEEQQATILDPNTTAPRYYRLRARRPE
jgi:hypothetical protein